MTKQQPKIHYAVRGGFDAASRSPEAMRHWHAADGLSADAALSATVRHIVISRARYECANNGYADGIIQTLAEDAVGTGPRLQLFLSESPDLQPREKNARASLQRREMRFRDWSEQIDLTEKLKLARIAKARDGEVFLRIVRNPKISGAAQFDVVLFEAEQVGSRIISEYADYYEDGTIKEFDGIQYDRFGNPSAFRFWKVHPGATGIGFITDDSVLVPADKVIQYAHIMRPGQHRGLSEIASTLNIFNDLRRYTNAVLSAAETAAEISFLLHTDTPADADEYDGNAKQQSPIKFMDVVELVRNAGLALPEGWDANQMKTEHPQDKYVDFVDAKIAEAARPLSMPFAIAKGDCSKSNYASGRLDHQIYHKKIFGERKRIERNILNRLLNEFESFDRIAFPADYQDENFVLHSWMWDGFEHVDPVKEANAQAIRLKNHTTTLAEECAREGKDYELVLRQIAREAQLAAELGLTAPGADAPAAGNADEDEDTQKEE